jgi:hypothetical protein
MHRWLESLGSVQLLSDFPGLFPQYYLFIFVDSLIIRQEVSLNPSFAERAYSFDERQSSKFSEEQSTHSVMSCLCLLIFQRSSPPVQDQHSSFSSSAPRTEIHVVHEQDILKKGQYEYNSFDEVLVWVNKYKERYGVTSMDYFLVSRDYFLSINYVGAAELMQDLVKNEIGIRRLEEDYPQPTVEDLRNFIKGDFWDGWCMGIMIRHLKDYAANTRFEVNSLRIHWG